MYGLADCNNFFVSCERVFRPDLECRPVVVMSGNDGCVVSRSNEAKQLGIPMGVPLYQIKHLVKEHQVECFSSNFALYGDLSHRVMTIIASRFPRLEQYSIDEAFFGLTDVPDMERKLRCEELVRFVRRGVGIPISIGVAPTRTLAKCASKFAKQYPAYHGVAEICTEEQRRKALSLFPVKDVWGIGRKAQARLHQAGIETALQFADCSEEFARGLLLKPGWMTWQELNGYDVIQADMLYDSEERRAPQKQSITTSRTFAQAIENQTSLEAEIAGFVAHCARQLRSQRSVCKEAIVYAHTSPFREDVLPVYLEEKVLFPVATNATSELQSYVLEAFRRGYRAHVPYKKAGVVLTHISPDDSIQQDLFDTRNREKDERLQQAIDRINDHMGRERLVSALRLGTGDSPYKVEHRSPLYTTDLSSIITIHAQ